MLKNNNRELWDKWEQIRKVAREKETEQARKEALAGPPEKQESRDSL